MMVLLLVAGALAADWPLLQGTETADDPPAVRPWGFVQALGDGVLSESPTAPPWGFSIRRARLGLRGVIPQTDDRVSWLIAAELGDNAVTRVDPVVLTDASVTFSYVPGARIRAGQFKLPIGEEALEMNPLAAEFVNLSSPTAQLLAESPVAGGAYTGGANGFRDVGVQVFDTFAVGDGALSYAVMLSNGRMGGLDLDDAKDVTGRIAWAPRIWGERNAVHRDEIGLFAFWQQGRREVDGLDAPRIRRGVGAQVEKAGWRVRVEVISASGSLEEAPLVRGDPAGLSPQGQAVGGYGYVHYERGLLGGGLRYDELWRGYESPADLRIFRTATADLQVEVTPKVRVMLDYELRRAAAPDGSEEAQAAAAALGDRVSLQAGAVF